MKEKIKITVEATINAELQKVWNYYTQPVHITQWNFAHPSWHCPSAVNDMRVGGKYIARMEARDGSSGFDFEAIYSAIIPNKSFSYGLEGRMVDVSFEESESVTKITVVFDAENENPIEMQKSGWQSILDNFKTYTENN